ncbi:MAG: hypothetical protein L0H79_16140 [Intrasporangium sp.]|uniref:hypothetical protein n=1 Tax=Intrasporangium sp. TaxID=1925024 RepID=UPI00264738FF|nr:hypothetical protein [Intrasporangium sp.]MDN5797267.1 hypothetical protein [Intrasporangium sp.]
MRTQIGGLVGMVKGLLSVKAIGFCPGAVVKPAPGDGYENCPVVATTGPGAQFNGLTP